MRVNEGIRILSNKVLLVPYEAHHVDKYHSWMLDPAIREATASEMMSLEEEYENQQSWRSAHDKLTFILCDAESSTMMGDVNFFLHEDTEDGHSNSNENENGNEGKEKLLRGEVDVMVAEREWRGKGVGSTAVRALLTFVRRHLNEVLDEYARGQDIPGTARLVGVMAKIREDNVGSRALFDKLGFRQSGDVNYFGEVTVELDWEDACWEGGYAEIDSFSH